ncbi:recQ-mediated genome instability protein 2-like isoform X1 [Panicum virgatum]|uniref:recQ-mediated genome instability protein 2-like isoform X1 n=1 Tax=Panicum virgatum TaxID=38727 RepID=UPI0019D58788|nr:recQ-mediated genome instability protein 2-like isoform X1 [Panicum virgatum]
MDYTLAALKIFGSQLAGSTEAPSSEGSSPAQMLFGIRFQRAWMQVPNGRQGVLLSANYNESGEGRLVLDDGSCVAELFVLPKEAEGRRRLAGMYVMVIGAYIAEQSKDNYPAIKVHKMVDLSDQPDREAMWYMEVAEAYNLFYLPFSVASPPS